MVKLNIGKFRVWRKLKKTKLFNGSSVWKWYEWYFGCRYGQRNRETEWESDRKKWKGAHRNLFKQNVHLQFARQIYCYHNKYHVVAKRKTNWQRLVASYKERNVWLMAHNFSILAQEQMHGMTVEHCAWMNKYVNLYLHTL